MKAAVVPPKYLLVTYAIWCGRMLLYQLRSGTLIHPTTIYVPTMLWFIPGESKKNVIQCFRAFCTFLPKIIPAPCGSTSFFKCNIGDFALKG